MTREAAPRNSCESVPFRLMNGHFLLARFRATTHFVRVRVTWSVWSRRPEHEINV